MSAIHLSLRARLRLGVTVLAAVLALLAIAATLSLNRLGSAIATILRENYVSIVAAGRMDESLERQDSAVLFAALGREELARAALDRERPVFREAFDHEAGNVTLAGEGALVAQVRADWQAYVAAVDRVLSLDRAARGDAYFHDVLPKFERLKAAIHGIHAMNQAGMEAADRDAKALAKRTVNVAIAIGAAAILFAVWFAWWLPRALVRPVDELSGTARAIGEGDLDVDVPRAEIPELAPLGEAFRRMLERLRAYRASSLGELLAARDLANATVSCLLDPVIVFGRSGEVLLANGAAERAFGLLPGTPEELRSLEVTVPESIASARDAVLAREEPVLPRALSEAMRWSSAEGERHYLVRAAPLRPEETVNGAVVVAQDVTRYRVIDELKSDVVATVSHQFKTPLTSLQMSTNLLLEPKIGALSDAQRELVVTAKTDADRLRAMVDELLDLVRIEAEAGALQRRPIDAAALLADVAEGHRAVAREKGVELAVEASNTPIEGDPERLSIVLANLVANAVRHTPSGGRVTLSASRDAHTARLVVRDTGEGIEGADLRRIFERTVTLGAEASRDRHGLGLAIAREIVLHHGGEIAVESAPGRGSTFTVSLPLDATARANTSGRRSEG